MKRYEVMHQLKNMRDIGQSCFAELLATLHFLSLFILGTVRAESFTRLPSALHPASMTDLHLSLSDGTQCVPNATVDGEVIDVDIVISDEDEELYQSLATKHYYSYTAALGVTIGVGCLLLMLNMLIFAGIYYQRERDKQVQNNIRCSSLENIPMSQQLSQQRDFSHPSPVRNENQYPSCYSETTATTRNYTFKKEKPNPPARASSNPGGDTVKKHVQIQEISV